MSVGASQVVHHETCEAVAPLCEKKDAIEDVRVHAALQDRYETFYPVCDNNVCGNALLGKETE